MAPAQRKILLSFLIATAIFLFLPRAVFAQVVINEFYTPTSDDWVELYNTSDDPLDISGWSLSDNTSSIGTIKEATISGKGFFIVEVGRRLNKDKDEVHLFDSLSEEKDFWSYADEVSSDVSFGRMPDGGSWGICQTLTKEETNSCILPTSTPTPMVAPEPTPTPTPKSSTPTPTPKTPTPTPTIKIGSPTPTPKKVRLISTMSGEVLGEGEEATTAFYPLEATEGAEPDEEATPSSKKLWLPKLFLVLGSVILFGVAFSLWYNFLGGKNIQG